MQRAFGYIRFILRFGVFNSLMRANNHFKVWRVDSLAELHTGNTSITDSQTHDGYSFLCDSAVRDDLIFSKFRSCVSIVDVLDHVTLAQAKQYASFITEKNSPAINHDRLKIAKKIDSIGDPLRWHLREFGIISPTIVRYLKVYGDLERLFGPIKDFDIAEIGIGFGGQTAVNARLGGASRFKLYDLPVVLGLAEKFLLATHSDVKFEGIDGRRPESSSPDLVISNYAFSEVSRELQDLYLTNVILNSSRGYLTWNNSAEDKLEGYTLAELLRLIPNSQILPEIPLTSTYNSIIVWGHRIGTY